MDNGKIFAIFGAAQNAAEKHMVSSKSLNEDTLEKILIAAEAHFIDVTPAEHEEVKRLLFAEFQSSFDLMPDRVVQSDDDANWVPWLPERRGKTRTQCWIRYQRYMASDKPRSVVAAVDRSTEGILGLLGDPESPQNWDRRGLVVGAVQSGKTANYVGLINKACDYGYRVIVVLTGFTESLRVQTQQRIDYGVLGRTRDRDHPSSRTVGVGFEGNLRSFSPMHGTSMLSDFVKTSPPQPISPTTPSIFVIKKNGPVMQNLMLWLLSQKNSSSESGAPLIGDMPLLVIDDECDVGSVDTRKGAVSAHTGEVDYEHDPTRINQRIRQLLNLFTKSCYVGYTATPYANVLIHHSSAANTMGQVVREKKDDPLSVIPIGADLFPKNFIVTIDTPKNHFGPRMIYDLRSEEAHRNELPLHVDETKDAQREEDPETNNKTSGRVCESETEWMPRKHRKDHVPLYENEEQLPPSLEDAVLAFLLVGCARRVRSQKRSHNAMLIHVTLLTDVQNRVHDQVDAFLRDVTQKLVNNIDHEAVYARMQNIWANEFVPKSLKISARGSAIEPWFQNSPVGWSDLKDHIPSFAGSVDLMLINGSSTDVLDYDQAEKQSRQINVICVGGNKLARGLTLEGLTTSYFLRTTKMYDTLMQMGRWFGYRDGYLDLCRIYTSRKLWDWFREISQATEELLDEFGKIGMQTPSEYGLRIKTHPSMEVTSRAKSRYGEEIQVSFEGYGGQLTDYDSSNVVRQANWDLLSDIVDSVDGAAVYRMGTAVNRLIWDGVPADQVVRLLLSYKGVAPHSRANPARWAEYIQGEVSRGRLTEWVVVVSGTQRGDTEIGSCGKKIGLVTRGWKLSGINIKDQPEAAREEVRRLMRMESKFSTGVIDDPKDELADFPDEDAEELSSLTREEIRAKRPSTRGLLVLYPLSSEPQTEPCELPKAPDSDIPFVGLKISFPFAGGKAKAVTYKVNSIYQEALNED